MKKYFLILIGLFSVAASVQMSTLNPEVRTYPLQIICPKCGYIFFNCPLEEIYENDFSSVASCYPAHRNIMPIKYGDPASLCPIDNSSPVIQGEVNGNPAAKYFTNKGWMPQRERPR